MTKYELRMQRLARVLSWLLTTFGSLWIIYGIALHDLGRDPLPILSAIPASVLAWSWVGSGALTVVLINAPKLPRWAAYPPAVFMPVVWSFGFLLMWVAGTPLAWEGMAMWLGFGVAVVLASIAERLTDVRS